MLILLLDYWLSYFAPNNIVNLPPLPFCFVFTKHFTTCTVYSEMSPVLFLCLLLIIPNNTGSQSRIRGWFLAEDALMVGWGHAPATASKSEAHPFQYAAHPSTIVPGPYWPGVDGLSHCQTVLTCAPGVDTDQVTVVWTEASAAGFSCHANRSWL